MKNKKRKIIITVFLFVALSLFVFLISISNIQNINKNKASDLRFEVAGINIGATENLFTINPNKPQLGAGMIPIKYIDGAWQITTEDDTGWYDYSNGKMATIMLSDGYFVSEASPNIVNHEIAISGVQVNNNDLGTILIWVPRMVKIEDDKYRFLKDYSVINYREYKTLDCFSYIKDKTSKYASTGIWVEKNNSSDSSILAKKINEMNLEENAYGLIKNEIIEACTADAKEAIKLFQNSTNSNAQQVNNIDNINRVTIRIIDTNTYEPLIVKAQNMSKTARITAYSENGVSKIFYIESDNNAIELNVSNNVAEMYMSRDDIYDFVVIDNLGNIQTVTLKTAIGIPDLTGFRLDTTYIVTYNENGNITENSSVSIKNVLKEGYIINKTTGALIKRRSRFKEEN